MPSAQCWRMMLCATRASQAAVSFICSGKSWADSFLIFIRFVLIAFHSWSWFCSRIRSGIFSKTRWFLMAAIEKVHATDKHLQGESNNRVLCLRETQSENSGTCNHLPTKRTTRHLSFFLSSQKFAWVRSFFHRSTCYRVFNDWNQQASRRRVICFCLVAS